jgi:hypothetical protein
MFIVSIKISFGGGQFRGHRKCPRDFDNPDKQIILQNSTKDRCFSRVKPKAARLPKKNNSQKMFCLLQLGNGAGQSASDPEMLFNTQPLN